MVRQGVQFALHRAVDHRVADSDPGAADQLRVDSDRGFDLLAEAPLQRDLEPAERALIDGESTRYLRPRHAIRGVLESVEELPDLRQQADALGFDQHANEAFAVGIELLAADRQKKRFLRRRRKPRIIECRAHARVARDLAREPQHLGPDREGVALARERKHRIGVGSGNGYLLGHRRPQSCFSSSASKSACALASTSRLRILAAPATASAATWPRNASLAR